MFALFLPLQPSICSGLGIGFGFNYSVIKYRHISPKESSRKRENSILQTKWTTVVLLWVTSEEKELMYLLLLLCYDSVEYWFRCMDLDGDGVLSMYEMEYFYVEQLERMEALGIETLPFEDCLCQVRMEVVDIETLPFEDCLCQ